nr:dephospho-CoA kinase [Kiritimatiellia bacterium]
MIHIAITGGIACGKSLAGKYLKDSGFAVADTDKFAKEVLKKNTEGAKEVVKAFGKGVVDVTSGKIDRRKLSEIAYSDSDKLALLESIVHPRVAKKVDVFLKESDLKGKDSVVMIPLLFEAGFEDGWNSIICLSSFMNVQLKRLEKRGIDNETGMKIIKAQLDDYAKRRKSDFVILNNGTKKTLKKQIDIVLN